MNLDNNVQQPNRLGTPMMAAQLGPNLNSTGKEFFTNKVKAGNALAESVVAEAK